VIRVHELCLVVIVAILACLTPTEVAGQQESSSAVVPAGSSTQRLVLTVAEPPASGDSIDASVSTADVRTKLITPDGERITDENAEAAGLSWTQGRAHPSPLGSDDEGQFTEITFRKRAPAGRYILEFSFEQLREPAKVEAHFISRMGEYLRLLQSTPGAQISKSVPLKPSATVTFDLPQEEEKLMFDIVVPDAGADVVLVLPDGRTLRQGDAKKPDVEWTISTNPGESTPRGLGLLLPLEGSHQIIWLQRAAKGRYEIHASPKTTTKGELRVAVVPVVALAKAYAARKAASEQPAPGEIQIRAKYLPFDCFVGDSLDVQFELLGDIGSKPPQFEVRLERRAWLQDVDGGVRYAAPDPVEVMPVQFTQVGSRTYRGTLVPTKPGSVRITVRATGKTPSGQPFVAEAFITNDSMRVKPIAARFLGVNANAMARDGDSKFDRLEVSATLDVLMPGDYLLIFSVQDAAGARLEGGLFSGVATLQAGRQNLTASVPSSRIWRELRDGPLEIANVQISRTQKYTLSGIEVRTGNATLRTPAYRHDQWDPGPVYGEDHVTVHGIYPLSSGRFLFAEVEWEVTTPGGPCEWNGVMCGPFRPASSAQMPPQLSVREEATLPAGKTKLSFFFDGATINRFGKQDWTLGAALVCGQAMKVNDPRAPFRWSLTPNPKIDLNPDDYEPSHGSFSVRAQQMLRLSPGGSGDTTVTLVGRSSKPVQFAVTDPPKGVEAKLAGPFGSTGVTWSTLWITTSPEASPGRYFLGIAATSGTEVATTQVVLDIVPK